MKELTQEIFLGRDIRVDFACVDFDCTLHFGIAINPRFTWASERWRGYTEIKPAIENSGFKPLTSIRLNAEELKVLIELKEREEGERRIMYCTKCMALEEEECGCEEDEEE